MTPHIVRPYENVRAILDKKLKERDDFIEAEAGGEDPMRGKRDEMIRSLPDLKELAKQRVQSNVILDEDSVTPENPGAVPGGIVPPGGIPAKPVNPLSPAVPVGSASLGSPDGVFPPAPPPATGGG
jgi:hypothetical protein